MCCNTFFIGSEGQMASLSGENLSGRSELAKQVFF